MYLYTFEKMMEQQENYIKKLFKKICRKTGVTLRDHDMIRDGDHLLLGLSGGKDSMILLEVLAERRSALPFNFDLTAAHIGIPEIGYSVHINVLKDLCHELNIPFKQRNIELEKKNDSIKSPCFACSWHRRKAIFELSKELECNKVVFGHHRYDALETLLINMIYHGSISSLPHKLSMFDGRIEVIRPLLEMDENLLMEYALLRDFKAEAKSCPHQANNQRVEVRKLLEQIEAIHGRGTYNMFHSMHKIFEEYLPQKKARTS